MSEQTPRNGYTTGSCAAAAAKAAAIDLYTGSHPDSVTIILPNKETARFPVEKVDAEKCCYRVRKDSGDDPDVTDKTYIYASCERVMADEREGNDLPDEVFCAGKTGYLCEGDPLIYIDGGRGIGIVTKEGLPSKVGHYAINPAPREEIARSVREVCSSFSENNDVLLITLSVPEGEALAKKTFNPRLGIKGGISILGTSGIVRPMSEEAILDTIRLELHMRAVSGEKTAVFVPGNYGEIFLKEKFNLPEGTAIMISNFVRDSVLMACEEGYKKVLFVGHIGKLIKVAAGLPNTHSRYGDKRMETFISLLSEVVKVDDELKERLMRANTTDEGIVILKEAFPHDQEHIIKLFLNKTARAVKERMEAFSEGSLSVEVTVFTRDGMTGATENVKVFLNMVTYN